MLGFHSQFRFSERELSQPLRFWPWIGRLLLRLVVFLAMAWGLASYSHAAVILDDFRDPLGGNVIDNVALTVPGTLANATRAAQQQRPRSGTQIVTSQAQGLAIDAASLTGAGRVDLYYGFSPFPVNPATLSDLQLHIEFTVMGDVNAGLPVISLTERFSIFTPVGRVVQDMNGGSLIVPFANILSPSRLQTERVAIRIDLMPDSIGTLNAVSIIPEPSASLPVSVTLICFRLRRRSREQSHGQ